MNEKKELLLVDDNEIYKELLESLYSDQDFHIHWVKTAQAAKEKMQEKGMGYYHTVITDITMETQTSGLSFAVKLRRQGFQGKIIIASTGFNWSPILWLSRFFLGLLGINELIPKSSLKGNQPLIAPCTFQKKNK
jgi:CheY-like chemotaxis protein